MTAQPQQLIIRRPDDWHIHLRDDEMLRAVLPWTSAVSLLVVLTEAQVGHSLKEP